MFRVFSAFVALAMTAWVLPLGAFIRSSQEATACGGGRAFHMCSMMAKAKTNAPEKITFVNAASPEKSPKSSATGGQDWLLEKAAKEALAQSNLHPEANPPFLPPFVHFPIDPVPKV